MKKIIIFFILLFCLSFDNVSALEIDSKNAVLYDVSNDEIIFEKNKDQKISIASLTKIMTSIITIEKIPDLNTKVIVPTGTTKNLVEENAARVGFIEGQRVTYNDLLHAALLPSGADGTQAMAILIAKSEKNFVKLMNQKAKEIGMKNTNFVNSSGFDNINHYSTVNDILILLRYALKNEKFKKIYETKTYTASDKSIYMESTVYQAGKKNNIDVSNIKGSKTGFTNNAGYCLASELVLNDNMFLLITASSSINGKPNHIIDANATYDYLKKSYSIREISKPNELVLTLKPKYAKELELNYYTNKKIEKFMKNDKEIKIEYIYNGKEDLFGNELAGTHLGSVEVLFNNAVIDTIDISVEKNLTFDYQKFFKQYLYLIPIVLTFIIIIILSIILVKKKHLKN